MAQKYIDHADQLRRTSEDRATRGLPTENPDQGMERQPQVTSLNQDIRARILRPHKGDVGRHGTNEEIFQGYKDRELK